MSCNYTALRSSSAHTSINGLAERYLQLAIEVTIDLGNHIIAELNLGYPEVSHDIPEIFATKGYIDANLRETWKKMIGFRNLLVHDYADIDRAIVYDVLQNRLSDLERLREVFAQFL